MSKKNIGAALSVIAASAVVATAYATTVTDLENDKHTNSLITEEDKGVDSSYSFVKSDYTKEVKNTKIAGKERDAKKASQEIKKDIAIEQTARNIIKPQIIKAEKVKEEKEAEEVVAYDDTNIAEVVNYDDKNLDELIEQPAEETATEVVEYDDSSFENVEETTYETAEENNETEIAEEAEAQAISEEVEETKEEIVEEVVEEEVKTPETLEKFVNTVSLNIRSSKDASNTNNIVRTINAGDKLVGYIEGEWFVTNEGYINLNYLANYYPQDLVNQIKAEAEVKKSEEAKKADEARLAEEAKKAEEARLAEEAKKAEEARLAEEAKKAEEARLAEEARKAEEAKAAEAQKQQKQQVQEVVKEVEEVVNTQAPANQGGQSVANIASQFVGLPYVWGSSNPSVGFDCSGLTSYAYRQMGITIPHSSAAQFNNGYAVDVNNLKAGDLVFFSFGGGGIDHVGMITSSDGTFVHASTPQTGVRIDNIFNGSFQTAFRGVRRIY